MIDETQKAADDVEAEGGVQIKDWCYVSNLDALQGMDCFQLLGAALWWVLEILKGLLPVMIAYLAYRVARQQRQISAQQARLALFERRFRILDTLQTLIFSNWFPDKFERPAEEMLRQAEFLFPDDIVPKFIKQVLATDEELCVYRGQRKIFEGNAMKFSKEIDELDKKIKAAIDSHSEQMRGAKATFERYLHVLKET